MPTVQVECSSVQFKSSKLKDKEYTINVSSFLHNIAQKKETDAHFLAGDQLLMLYLPLLDICGPILVNPKGLFINYVHFQTPLCNASMPLGFCSAVIQQTTP